MPKHGTLEPYAAGTWMAMHQRVHQGETCRAVAKEFGVDNSLMRRRWDTLGLPKMDKDEAQRRRSAGCAKALLTDAEIIDKGVELHQRGLPIRLAARVAGVSRWTLRTHMEKRGVVLRPAWKRRLKISDEQIREAYALWMGGAETTELAQKYSVSQATFYSRWLKMGLPPRQQRRKDFTGNWLKKRIEKRKRTYAESF